MQLTPEQRAAIDRARAFARTAELQQVPQPTPARSAWREHAERVLHSTRALLQRLTHRGLVSSASALRTAAERLDALAARL